MECSRIIIVVFSCIWMICDVRGQSRVCIMPPVHAHSTHPTNITLGWSLPSCSEDITHYVVTYRQAGSSDGMSRNININRRNFTASSLLPNTTYDFEVALANTVGVWSSSSITTTTSSFIRVPSAPNLIGTEVYPTSVVLTWTQSPQDFVEEYEINYWRIYYCTAAPSGNRTIRGYLRSYNLSDLEANIGYMVTIRAINSLYHSTNSRTTLTTNATTPSCCVPSPQVQSTSESTVTITWQREHCLLRNGQPEDYILRYGLIGSTMTSNVTNIYPYRNPSYYTVQSLFTNAWYKFEVALRNQVGVGPFSSVYVYTGSVTNSTSSPGNTTLTVLDALSTSISITWTQSVPVDYYVLQYHQSRGCSVPSLVNLTVEAEQRNYTLTQLEVGSTYGVTLIAFHNEVSTYVDALSVNTLPKRPSCCVPTPQVTLVTPVNIIISWDREECGTRNGRSQYYNLRYKITGSNNIIATENVSINNRVYTANFLTPGTEYVFEVALVNVKGQGPYTMVRIPTRTITDVGFFLRGIYYFNNSLVLIDNIGINTTSLMCLTPFTACCSSANSAQVNWFQPHGNRVENTPTKRNRFWQTRHARTVLLHHKEPMAASVGLFTCRIPLNSSSQAELFLGVYSSNLGSPVVSSLTYDNVSGLLTCESNGGPATTVTWNRMSPAYQQSQRIVNTSTATYLNYLRIISSELGDYYGMFSCTVSNVRGEDTASMTVSFPSAFLSNNQTSYQHGSSVEVTCTGPYRVISIQWINSSNSEVLASTSEDSLTLHIQNISSHHHRATYTCVVEFLLPSGASSTINNSFTIITAPGMVEDVVATASDDDTLVLEWDTPLYFAQDNLIYTVSVFPLTSFHTSTPRNTILNITTRNPTTSITGLEEGIPYNVCITASNSAGSGGKVSSIYFTRELEPSAVPKNITTTWSSSTSIKVTWTPLALYEARGHIISYTVFYSSITTGVMKQVVKDVESGQEKSKIELHDLQEESTYLVQVRATTIAGPGPISPVVIVPVLPSSTRTDQIPSAITVSILPSNVWTDRLSAIIGGIVAVAFLLSVAAVIITIIVRKYKYSLKILNQKEDHQSVELNMMKDQQDPSKSTSTDGTTKDSPTIHSDVTQLSLQKADSQHYTSTNIHLDQDPKPSKGNTSITDSEDCNVYFPLKPVKEENPVYENVNIKHYVHN